MIEPLLKISITGAIFYQGESDCGGGAALYACRFPAMIDDWRARWSAASDTNPTFPFGFVQLAPWGRPTSGVGATSDGVPTVRFGQTANVGMVPNKRQPRTFMAVAVDLGAYEGGCCAGLSNCSVYPSLCIHPQWKQEVGRRLALGARAIAYVHSRAMRCTRTLSACISGPCALGRVALRKVRMGHVLSSEVHR